MPSKRVAITAGVMAQLTEVDPNRKVIVIANYFTTPGYVANIFDSSDFRTELQNFRIPPTPNPNTHGATTLTLLKSDGDATDQAWYAYSAFSMFVVVHEGF